ncbi:MAG: hypothetical protein QM831_05615 [Kofleriaceae bacterium]
MAAKEADRMIMVKDTSDHDRIVASVRIGKPCRATIGPNEMIIGGPPLVSQLGDTRWEGSAANDGVVLTRNTETFARFVDQTQALTVFDPTGTKMVSIAATATAATVTDGTNTQARTLALADNTITVTKPQLKVTGTNDLVLASVLTAPELAPEVRMLAACERVLSQKQEL